MSRLIAALSLCLIAAAAVAQPPRAWLDRDRIELGETVTLNVEVTDSMSRPDFSVLDEDFEIRGSSSSTQMTLAGGRAVTQALWAAALEPRREGVVTVPAIPVGDGATQPMTLTVLPPRVRSAAARDPVFVETELSTREPYVHQAVTYTVRLFYALTLLEGQLDAPEPEGAALRRLGEDASATQTIDGTRYNVVERRYVLIPERSGPLQLAPPRFRGRTLAAAGARFGAAQTLNAMGEAFELTVRPRPTSATLPWLPARAVSLAYESVPAEARAGEPLTLTLRLRADGITAEQLPEIGLPETTGVQVYPEAPSFTEQISDGRPRVDWSRRFALVASRPGRIEVPAFTLAWWNLETDRADRAEVPALAIAITGDEAAALVPPADDGLEIGDAPTAPPSPSGAWPLIAGAVIVLWLMTAIWGWRRGHRAAPAAASSQAAPSARASDAMALRAALRGGDLDEIARALLAAAPGGGRPSLARLADSLADAEQRDALRQLESARWGGGGKEDALVALRAAFARPIRLVSTANGGASSPLPPHYPRA